MLKEENKIYSLSLAIAKSLFCKLTIPELAVVASFLQSLAANISVHIQTTNLQRVQNENTEPVSDELV